MSSLGAAQPRNAMDDALLDADTSAAILRWMETGQVPDGIDLRSWEDWVESGCVAALTLDGAAAFPWMSGDG